MGNQDLDIRYDLYLSLEESVFGVKRKIEVPCLETCDSCSGTGAKSSSCIKSCTDCGGRGGVMRTQTTPFGMMSQVSTCSKCSGVGTIITDHCRTCGGSGTIRSNHAMEVVIPPGVDNGATVQLRGKGNINKKRGIAGDLFVILHINEKHGIWRDGHHLYSKINVDYTQAILGTVLKVETVEGLKDLHIPSGIQPGDTLKLPQKGVPDIRKPSVRGDHRFIVNILIPKGISDKERTLVKELASLRSNAKDHEIPFNNTGTSESNFDKKPKDHASKRGIRSVTTLWKSITKFLQYVSLTSHRFQNLPSKSFVLSWFIFHSYA
uniref:CR-type domain-containing protein n=1 Tax=Rhizophora mucronata TaxID=61149 RepID=A0A2P2KPG2_RHIMU